MQLVRPAEEKKKEMMGKRKTGAGPTYIGQNGRH